MAVGLPAVGVLVGTGVLDGAGIFVVVGVSVISVVFVVMDAFVGSGEINSARVSIGAINVVALVGNKVDVGSRPAVTGCTGIDVSFALLVMVLFIRKSARQQQLRAKTTTITAKNFAVLQDFQKSTI